MAYSILRNELTHRVKNTLAIVQSIAVQTMQNSPTMEVFQDAFEARLEALAKTHNLLMQNPSQVVTLRAIWSLANYCITRRTTIHVTRSKEMIYRSNRIARWRSE
jgi:two-component sensor histidine kinase